MVRYKSRGAVAQLGERLVRNEEASGSIPLSSTNFFINLPHRLHPYANFAHGLVCCLGLLPLVVDL